LGGKRGGQEVYDIFESGAPLAVLGRFLAEWGVLDEAVEAGGTFQHLGRETERASRRSG